MNPLAANGRVVTTLQVRRNATAYNTTRLVEHQSRLNINQVAMVQQHFECESKLKTEVHSIQS